MKLFRRKDEKSLVVKEQPIVVSVPDIKEHLLREYERVRLLENANIELQNELDAAEEIKMKYDAALVTLDEYSKRLKNAERTLEEKQQKITGAKNEALRVRDELNNYKIKFNDLALTKEAMREEIIDEVKKEIISAVSAHKGNLSKSLVCRIITETKINPTEKGGEE